MLHFRDRKKTTLFFIPSIFSLFLVAKTNFLLKGSSVPDPSLLRNSHRLPLLTDVHAL